MLTALTVNPLESHAPDYGPLAETPDLNGAFPRLSEQQSSRSCLSWSSLDACDAAL
jgi:hypothetical protein